MHAAVRETIVERQVRFSVERLNIVNVSCVQTSTQRSAGPLEAVTRVRGGLSLQCVVDRASVLTSTETSASATQEPPAAPRAEQRKVEERRWKVEGRQRKFNERQ